MIGEWINNKYRIESMIGEGGMAVVYLARTASWEKPVAIKMIRTELIAPKALPDMIRRFQNEARLLQRIQHPGIVQLLDFGEHQGRPYLVMEYINGGTLKKHAGSRVAWRDGVAIILQITEALAFAHSRGVIHRDIKPSNILMDDQGHPRISDFGIARLADTGATSEITHTGGSSGTPRYMAPEQWHGVTTEQTDVYAVGVLLYELLTGRAPYHSDKPIPYMVLQSTQTYPAVRSLVRTIPIEVDRIVERCLAKEPGQRYEKMNKLVYDLVAVITHPSRPGESVSWSWIKNMVLEGVASIKQVLVRNPRRSVFVPLFLMVALSLFLSRDLLGQQRMKPVPMALVPAGEFIMGGVLSMDKRKAMYVDAFYMDIYEVTNAAFQACVRDGGCEDPWMLDGNEYYNNPEYREHPVIYITQFEAQNYCRWREGSLPNEAQWLKAALGTDGRMFPWGDNYDESKSHNLFPGVMQFETARVGSYPGDRSPYGIYDMAGNVQEWTFDRRSNNYVINGSFMDVYYREVIETGSANNTVGFRCVVSFPPEGMNIQVTSLPYPSPTIIPALPTE